MLVEELFKYFEWEISNQIPPIESLILFYINLRDSLKSVETIWVWTIFMLDILQVSTETGPRSHYFNLHISVPTAFILGSDEYHTQAGTAISLVCIIENVSHQFQSKSWLFSIQIIMIINRLWSLLSTFFGTTTATLSIMSAQVEFPCKRTQVSQGHLYTLLTLILIILYRLCKQHSLFHKKLFCARVGKK